MTYFQPVLPSRRRAATGCITQINDHLFEGRYSPMWINGKKLSRKVYAHTREECEETLKVLIVEIKAELAGLKKQKAKAGSLSQIQQVKKGPKTKIGR